MNRTFKKNLNISYMIISAPSGTSIDDFSIKMLSKSTIPGLLPFGTEYVNGKIQYLYNITSLYSFEKTYDVRRLSAQELTSFLKSLREMINSIEDYLLDAEDIILDAEYIFMDSQKEKFYFCCCPHYNHDILDSIMELCNNILVMIDYEDPKAVSIGYELNRLVSSPYFTIADLDGIINTSMIDVRSVEGVVNGEHIEYVRQEEPVKVEVQQHSFSTQVKGYFRGKKFFEIMDDINSGGVIRRIKSWQDGKAAGAAEEPGQHIETGVSYIPLTDSIVMEDFNYSNDAVQASAHYILPSGAGRSSRCMIDKYPFTIGNEAGDSNYKLNSPAISDIHCRIIQTGTGAGEELFLEDMNSVAGTFLNNELLEAYTPAKLQSGDHILIGDVELIFR